MTARKTMTSGLYIIGTPIGNLSDITQRAIDTLSAVDFILAENTRHSRILLEKYKISAPMTSCHKFNEASRTAMVIKKIEAGLAVGLITSAGMPAVSDPGARIVAACRAGKLPVTVIPGPSAVSSALSLSGLDCGRYLFEGFLARKPGARKKRLEELASLSFPVVIFESPYRCMKLLEEMDEFLQNHRIMIFRELTKLNEECLAGRPAEIIELLRNRLDATGARRLKGEITIVMEPGQS